MMNAPMIAGVLFALAGLYFLRESTMSYRTARQSLHWSHVQGTVLTVNLWGSRRVGDEMKPVEHLEVTYRYSVNDVEFENDRIANYTLVYPETLTWAQSHPESSQTDVYVNPENPREAILKPGPRPGYKQWGELILSFMTCIVGCLLVWGGYSGLLG